ncbi:hypothetical protein OIDMADRAFT_26180 [Oidiodendron maius Zn]|uniref:C2H2-type domain-containing protein n=1 Tax=Oidiodendron maius (strain Zn) TaxID=913774 RepID=A0A0C3DN78_OIDMZ|nr:hypothetical protein OIDMADRAFT_26180 [Oidiodendron maius Zn]
MSTFIDHCPGCQHMRCKDCPLDKVMGRKFEEFSNYPLPGESYTKKSVKQSRPQALPPEPMSKTSSLWLAGLSSSRTDHPESTSSKSAEENVLTLRPKPQASSDLGLNVISSTSKLFSVLLPPPEFSSTSSRCSSDTFSHRTLSLESATDASDDTESDQDGSNWSGPDDGGISEVVRMLDCRLLSLLTGNLDLASLLIPKIHYLLNTEDDLEIVRILSSFDQTGIDYLENKGPAVTQRTFGVPSRAVNQNSNSNSSLQKHGRDSGGSNGAGEGSNSKRPRRQIDETPSADPSGNSDGDPVDNRGSESGEIPSNDVVRDPTGDKRRDPNDPDRDPGDDPSCVEISDTPPDFACHFHKLNPLKYGPWTDRKYEKCPGSRITELRRIKYHFKAVHRTPQCSRCYRMFQNQKDVENHNRETIECLKGPSGLKESIDFGQWDEIELVLKSKRNQKHINDVSRWYAIWDILFPGVKQPSNPWNEPPGSAAHPICNVDELLSKFKKRIEGDITLPQEEQLRQRYLYHLRQTLEEYSAACGLIQLQRSGKGKAREEEFDTPNIEYKNSSNLGHATLRSGNGAQVPFQDLETWEGELSNRHSAENLSEQIQHAKLWFPSATPSLNTGALTMDFLDPTQAQNINLPTLDSTLGQQNGLQFDLNINLREGSLDQFCGHDFDAEGASFLGLSTMPQPKVDQNATLGSDAPHDKNAPDCFPGGDLISDLLYLETEMPEAMWSWKDKHSGGRFLELP